MDDPTDRVAAAVAHWNLTLGEPLAGGTLSAVHGVRDPERRDLVLKIPVARGGGSDPASAEVAALTAWRDTGATVRLLDHTADALLLVRARPGRVHPWSPLGPVDVTAGIAAELMNRIWAAPPGPRRFPGLLERYAEAEDVAREDAAQEQRTRDEPDRGMPGVVRLPAAARAASELIADTTAPVLLHGDLITKNLVSDDGSPVGWLAIDPLPVVGDPCAEAGAFAAYHPAELVLPLAEAVAIQARLDPGRTLRWAAIWAVHQAAQAWRDDQRVLDQLVASPEVTRLLAGRTR